MKKRPIFSIIDFPIDAAQRRRNRLGKNTVPCLASERWIEFPKRSAGKIEAGELIKISIMTNCESDAGKSKKICDLLVTKESLLRALETVETTDLSK